MKLGPVIGKMMKNTEKKAYEENIKPLLTITVSHEPDEEEEEDPLESEEGETSGISDKFRKGY